MDVLVYNWQYIILCFTDTYLQLKKKIISHYASQIFAAKIEESQLNISILES